MIWKRFILVAAISIAVQAFGFEISFALESVDHYRQAIEREPDNPEHHANLAQALAQPEVGDWQGAYEHGKKALQMGNRDPGLISTMRMARQRIGSAKPLFSRDLSESLKHVQASEKLSSRNPRRALSFANESIRLGGKSSRAYLAKTNALLRMTKYSQALASIAMMKQAAGFDVKYERMLVKMEGLVEDRGLLELFQGKSPSNKEKVVENERPLPQSKKNTSGSLSLPHLSFWASRLAGVVSNSFRDSVLRTLMGSKKLE